MTGRVSTVPRRAPGIRYCMCVPPSGCRTTGAGSTLRQESIDERPPRRNLRQHRRCWITHRRLPSATARVTGQGRASMWHLSSRTSGERFRDRSVTSDRQASGAWCPMSTVMTALRPNIVLRTCMAIWSRSSMGNCRRTLASSRDRRCSRRCCHPLSSQMVPKTTPYRAPKPPSHASRIWVMTSIPHTPS
jgi:hypothetical protein